MSANMADEIMEAFSDTDVLSRVLNVSSYVISCFGIPLNVLGLLILFMPEMKSPINCWLQLLFVFDGLFLLTWPLALNGIGDTAIIVAMCITCTGSAYATLGLSLERFVALCYPMKHAKLFTGTRKVICIVSTAIFVICLNLPRFWFSEAVGKAGRAEYFLYYHIRFGSQFDQHLSDTVKSELYFVECYAYVQIVFMYCVPLASISFFNICIYIAVKKTEMTRGETRQSKHTEITLSIFGIIVLFFICWTPMSLFKVTSCSGIIPLRTFFIISISAHIFLGLNSAVNSVIYCMLRSDFRKKLQHMICKRRQGHDVENTVNTIELDIIERDGTSTCASANAVKASGGLRDTDSGM